MLKKAGIVVLGATAGMLSLAPLASAGEAPSHGGDHGNHGHHDNDRGHGRGGNDCGDFALSQGDSLVNASNVLANADVEDIAILGDNRGDDDCSGGGRGGHGHGRDGGHGHGGHGHGHNSSRDDDGDVAVSQGDSLVNASNLLANADVSDIAVLGSNR